jgi:PAS domain S-box-containing protein
MIRVRNEIWCLLGWTLAVVAMRIGDETIRLSDSRRLDVILHFVFWAVGILALHLIFRAFRRHGIEQEKARQDLRSSEQRYRELFMHMSEGFSVHEMIHDAAGRPVDYRFVAVNPAFERLTGLSAAAIIGRTVREVIPGIETEWIQRYGRVVETGEPIRFEQPASELGKVFSVEAFRPAPGMFACTFTDITEQRAREETIVQNEARLSAILQSIDDLVFVIDNEGRFGKFARSERAELLTTAAGFEGRLYSEVLPPIVSERLAFAIERVRATGRTEPFEYELTIDGMTTCWSARVSPLRDPERGILGSVVVTRDITIRRLGEQRLRQRNRFLEGVENISTILLGGIDAPDTFDRVAQEVALMTGFSSSVITLVSSDTDWGEFRFVGLAGVENDQRVLPEYRLDNSITGRVIRERTAVSIEGVEKVRDAVHERFKGELFARVVAVPIFHGERALGSVMVADRQSEVADSVLVHVLSGVANQIAIHLARIETEKARRRNEVELLSIYEHAPVIMALLDESAGVIRSNRAAQEFSGMSYEAGRALRPGELLGCLGSLYNKDGCGHGPVCSQCALRHAVLDTIHTGKTYRQIDVRKEVVSGKSIKTVELLVSTAPLNLDGGRRVLLVMEDVTKVRVAEDRVREQAALLDVTHDAIFVHDTTGRVLYWNKGAETLYHVPRTDAVGRRVEELIVSKAPVAATGSVGSIGGVTENEQTTRDGREIVVQSRRSEIRDDSGAVRSILVVNTDITEVRRLNQHLLRAQRLESIGTLASGIAHDLNNILAPIMMSIGLLKPNCGESDRSILEMIETCVRRGGDILRQVLLFARGVDGQRVAVQPRHMLNEVLRIIRETFPRSISITTKVCAEPWTITGDPTQIQQVLLNVCVNARDAMPHGGELHVEVGNRTIRPDEPRIHPRAEPGRYVLIEISDTGTGMPPELLEKIFDPFFTTKPQGQGTGLGLATSLGIVEKHGGFVHVQSTVGQGSTFCIYFPGGDASPAAAVATEAPVPAGDGARILVVDDEPAVRMLVKHMLQIAGYRVSVAYDGQEAVELLRGDKEGFAVIVTDLMMPRLDGVRFIEALRTMLPGQSIIAMTGVGEERRVQDAMAAGVKIVLNKPFESAELLRTIDRVRRMSGGLAAGVS